MIEINNLNKSYGKFPVLKDINLHFEKGTTVALMGPNGSGKTTLLKCILGLVIPEKGEIIVNNLNIRNNYLYRDNIGYMPQTAFYPDNLKSKEVISIIRNIRGKGKATDFELQSLFKTDVYEAKTISSLSQGMKQRLSGALTFMFDSGIIILDEPTAGLDPASSEHLKKKILKEKEKGKLIIFTTHTISEVVELADRFIFMLEGKIHLDEELYSKGENNGRKISELISKLFHENEQE